MADNPHVQYEVLHQNKSTQPDGRGGLEEVWRIHYQSPSGTKSYVDLPADVYTPRNVHDAIAHELQRVEGVHALGQGPPPPHEDERPPRSQQ